MPENVRIEANQLAQLWQLSVRARVASNEQTLAFTIVNETQALVPYRQAAWWRASPPLPGAVGAVSGLPQSDPGAPYIQWLGAVCRTLTRLEELRADAPAAGMLSDPAATPGRPWGFTVADVPTELAADWSAWWPACGLWVPLIDAAHRSFGAVVLVRDTAWNETEQALLGELAQVWAHALGTFAPRAPWFARARVLLRPGVQRRRALTVLALACVVPVPLTVLAPAEVTAKDPFVVRAPLDGVIDRLYTQPNQSVVAGTPLFTLDSTTLASRYALANKDLDTAEEEYRQIAQLAVTDDKDRLDMALKKGKLDESEVERDYSAAQLARIRVRATRAGVAVFADPNDWIGRAVSVGERVMLIADPANVELTAWLPVAENINVKPGATLTLYPKSSPLNAYDARIDTVAYRAEPTPEGVLAYRVKATFVGAARPVLGVMGTARIHGPWVPLVYFLLRRPLVTVRQWLGW